MVYIFGYGTRCTVAAAELRRRSRSVQRGADHEPLCPEPAGRRCLLEARTCWHALAAESRTSNWPQAVAPWSKLARDLLALLLALAAVLGINTLRKGSRQIDVAPLPRCGWMKPVLRKRLAEAVRLRTISSLDDPGLNADQFRQLHARCCKRFPKTRRPAAWWWGPACSTPGAAASPRRSHIPAHGPGRGACGTRHRGDWKAEVLRWLK